MFSIFFYGFSVETKSQSLKHDTLKINKLASSWENAKIAYLTDLTYGNAYTLDSLKTTVKKVNSSQPDLVIYAGMFFDTEEKLKINENDIIEQLRTLKAPLGKFAFLPKSLTSPEELEQIQRILMNADFQILNNENRYLYRKTIDPLNIISINKEITPEKKLQLFESSLEVPSLLISEDPEVFNELTNYKNIQLILSYGTYGGNIGLPFINSYLAKTQYPSGIYNTNDQTLLVSSGLGTQHDFYFRIFNHPKIYLITIQSKK